MRMFAERFTQPLENMTNSWSGSKTGNGGGFATSHSLLRHTGYPKGWSGGAMVLGKLPVPGRPTIWLIVGQGPIALAVGADGGCLDIFTLIYPFSPLSHGPI